MIRETPTISNSNYASSTTPVAGMLVGNVIPQQAYGLGLAQQQFDHLQRAQWDMGAVAAGAPGQVQFNTLLRQQPVVTQEEEVPMANQRRLVQVYIVDADESVPLTDAVIYRGDQQFTDLTDQELFFEIDLKGALAEHNVKRTQLRDKRVKGERIQNLEPARIRDLKMTVVNIATF